MIFLKLFIIFTKIGTFNFGGGYAMLSLIHNEVVVKNAWLSNAEFTDIVAISQSTPGCHLFWICCCIEPRLSRMGCCARLYSCIALYSVAAVYYNDSDITLSDES